jgi:4-hydroxythreonine-4-phosphate dehydrogenase
MKHPIVFTMGDPLGIGPETIARLFAGGGPELADCVVVGDVAVMRRAASFLRSAVPLSVAQIASLSELSLVPPSCIPVLQVQGLPHGLAELPMGTVDVRAGRAAMACIQQSAALALQGEVAAVVTAPIHKEALALAGSAYPGHTEMLQALSVKNGTIPPVRMMLANDELRVVLVTIHMSLRRAIEAVTFDAVLQTLRITHDSGAAWGRSKPRIAVAGLNPHAGEGGLLGDEEQRIIAPAIQAARNLGIDAHGPFAPDTIFMRARRSRDHMGEFDVVLAMTHDHGLIPVKYLGIEQGVNVTLGLPFIRTSPDHGTAFDIAGLGRADASSLRAALRMARQLAVSEHGNDQCFACID